MSEPLRPFDPDAAAAPGSGIFGLPFSPEESAVVLLPVPFEATTSYGGGTADGPAAILSASHQVDLFDRETGKPYESGLSMLEISDTVRAWNDEAKALAAPVIEAGGAVDEAGEEALRQVNARCEQMNAWVYEETRRWLSAGKRVGLIGGDHSTPYGCILAHAEKYPGMGILHLDAHADLRNAYEGFTWSHASIMYNVMTRIPQVGRLVQVGIRDFGEAESRMIDDSAGRIVTFFDADLKARSFEGHPWARVAAEIVEALPQQVYLSFDIDGLDPVLCPHTGTPVPGGLSFAEAAFLVGCVVKSGREIVGFDLNEVAPGPDDEWDGNVAARLLYKMIGWMLRSRREGC
jgi:agmatinase